MADGHQQPESLTHLPIFGSDCADCAGCELRPQLEKRLYATAYRPSDFNGVMIIGEGPGNQEVAQKRPFVGVSGRLLRGLLDSVGIDLDECYITNSTLCKPPPKDDALHAAFPTAIPSCLGRLEAEIEAVKPRVIITLGAAAFIAVTGYDKTVVKRVRFDCPNCDDNRKVGPVLECNASVPSKRTDGKTAERCGHLHYLDAASKSEVDPEEVAAIKANGCSKCGAKLKNVRPKLVKCPVCKGHKMRPEEFKNFTYDYNLGKVAGAIFEPYPGMGPREGHHVDQWFAEQGVRYIVPTYHPAFLLRNQQFMAKAVQKHLDKAGRLLEQDSVWPVNYRTTTDPEVVREFCWRWEREGREAPNFSVDLETEALGKDADGKPKQLDARKIYNVTKIKCIGIGSWREGSALVVDTREVDPDADNDPLLDVLQDFLEDERIPKTYSNGACYDVPVLDLVWGIPWENQIDSYTDDVLHAHSNLYPDEPHDLGHITFSFTDARAWKPARNVNGAEVHGDFEELALYNARDVLNTDASREAMGVNRGRAVPGGKMDRCKLSKIYEMDSRIRQIAVSMTMRGMPLNKDKFREAGVQADKNLDEAVVRCRELLDKHTVFRGPKGETSEEFNPFSVPQLAVALFSRDRGFNLPVLAKSKTGPTTDAPVMQKLMASCKDDRPISFIKAVLDVREHNKIRSTYIYSPSMQPWADGRIHPIWTPWGARTGRFSSKPNAQNWPKWLRVVVEAPPGRKLIGSDYDQLELRGQGSLYGDPELCRRCLEADDQRKLEPEHDPHSYVAQLAFGATYTSLSLNDPKHAKGKCKCETCRRKALRDLIKRVIYGLAYGAGARTVLDAIHSAPGGYDGPPITLAMVVHVQKTVFKAFSVMAEGREKLLAEAKRTEEIRSPLYGRRRIFPLGDVPMTEIFNYPIQSYGADIVNERMILLYDALPDVDPTAFIFAQVHDAVYVEGAEDRAEAIAKLMDAVLPCEKTLNGIAMTFSAGSAISQNWKEAA